MDVKKYCIVCGTENFSTRSNFCCEKCRQKYYYQQNKQKRSEYKKEYYQTHKEECDSRHNTWVHGNRAHWNEYIQKRREEKKEDEKNI